MLLVSFIIIIAAPSMNAEFTPSTDLSNQCKSSIKLFENTAAHQKEAEARKHDTYSLSYLNSQREHPSSVIHRPVLLKESPQVHEGSGTKSPMEHPLSYWASLAFN
ncbi:hypothetical protein PCASD_06493 [Puccinia coronata f. sp. avenae]|uniref:Uncharacterized protein n=1 Tax=Puccinia coronata f. sp. avenae TaxID=200324 RepID=A0A2N5V1Y0_9BASI|nr:hypothetical protein PCASD_06493 [Puccinia coronata f. sp. avenae]